MSRRIIVRPKAVRDLQDIWTYTLGNWGRAQADAYARELEEAFERIAEQPELGSNRSYIQAGLRKSTAAAHAVYYFHDHETVRISRVLHFRRDAKREL